LRSKRCSRTTTWLKTLALLPLVYRHVGMASKPLNRIADTLAAMGEGSARNAALVGERVDGDPTPKALLAAIAEVRKRDSWQALAPMRSRIFPTNLIASGQSRQLIDAFAPPAR
jgi:hypothetical protein